MFVMMNVIFSIHWHGRPVYTLRQNYDLIRNGANKLIEAKSCKNQLILSNEKTLKMELI